MEQQKIDGQKFEKKDESKNKELLFSTKNANLTTGTKFKKEMEEYCKNYVNFLNSSKTEREFCENAVKLAKENGFNEFNPNDSFKPGDKIYLTNRNKNLILAVIGEKSVDAGINFSVAHTDSPRLDLKPIPLFEDSELAFLKTHYYGGLKKYQWTTIPLSIHGVIYKKNNEKVSISIGEAPEDPFFCVTDLLPHLAMDQMALQASKLIDGEKLNVLIGSCPDSENPKENPVKLNILKLLNQKYGIVERDFVSAEIEIVPAFNAKEVGLDRSLIGGYGQDDKVCAFNAMQAIFSCKNPEKTTITVLVDKEEIGSYGNTGMECCFFENFVKDLGRIYHTPSEKIFSNSECLSADVEAAFDPAYAEVFEKRNCAYSGHGTSICKYTGSRGKSGGSDASAEFINKITRLLDDKEICWQTAEIGKVDAGGGGTVAMFLARLNVDVIDIGVPIISMHAPFEVASKVDIFENYRAITAFFNQ